MSPSARTPIVTAPLDTMTTSRPGLPQARHALDDVGEAVERELDAVIGDDVRAQLDDDALGVGEVAARLGHGRSIYRRPAESTRSRCRVAHPAAP